ncbi:MAG: ATP-binding cassette domain-containing protein [Fimbriimonas sp.]
MPHLQVVLEVEGLGKRFGGRWVFRGLSFQLGRGDRLAVLGINGSGKSTLLKVISGLLPQSEGTVKLPCSDLRRCLGLSALEQSLYPMLTVAEHLDLAARLRGCDSRAVALLKLIGLDYAADVQASHLSTGMKARLKMALAVQAQPEVLLLDEPGAGLDEEGHALVQTIVQEQASRGCVIFASNDPSERRLANLELRLES